VGDWHPTDRGAPGRSGTTSVGARADSPVEPVVRG
jgi:hypothetical protein